jgi:hypothetical protein
MDVDGAVVRWRSGVWKRSFVWWSEFVAEEVDAAGS